MVSLQWRVDLAHHSFRQQSGFDRLVVLARKKNIDESSMFIQLPEELEKMIAAIVVAFVNSIHNEIEASREP